MSKEEIKSEINKILDHFSDKALQHLLSFLKQIQSKQESPVFSDHDLEKILNEDKGLLEKLSE